MLTADDVEKIVRLGIKTSTMMMMMMMMMMTMTTEYFQPVGASSYKKVTANSKQRASARTRFQRRHSLIPSLRH